MNVASHGLLVFALVATACSSGTTGSRVDSGAASPATESSGTGVAGGAGKSAGASGQSVGTAGQNAGAVAGAAAGGTSSGSTGNMASAGGSGSSGAAAAGDATGPAGSSGGTGASSGAARGFATSGFAASGGVFVMCDDHADFNGLGLCSPTEKFGTVVATQTLGDSGAASTTLSASFGLTKPVIDPGCTQEAVGAACTADTCIPTSNYRAEPQAGTITASSNGGMIVMTPDAMGYYANVVVASALWTMPMAELTFTAAGGVIPAFSETFCGPVSATITNPASAPGVGPGRGLTIDRSTDLAVEWTGGAVGAAAATVAVHCLFTGASGQGTVPQAALAMISAGAHTIASNLWVRKISLPVGTCVEVTAVITNLSAAGGIPFGGDATFL
jgi:hypothetical protein